MRWRASTGNGTLGDRAPSATSSCLMNAEIPQLPAMDPTDASSSLASAAERIGMPTNDVCNYIALEVIVSAVAGSSSPHATVDKIAVLATRCKNAEFVATLAELRESHSRVLATIATAEGELTALVGPQIVKQLKRRGMRKTKVRSIYKVGKKIRLRVDHPKRLLSFCMLSHGWVYDPAVSVHAQALVLKQCIDDLVS